jgi:DNA-binding NarL/FixJ family response regulator
MNILVIDDHPLLRAGLGRLFAIEFEAIVHEAATAAEGLQYFLQCKPDITVLDLNLPDQGGLSLLRRLREEEPEARIVVLSMYDDAMSAAACLRGGALAYLSKSAGPDEILEGLRKALDGKAYLQPDIAQTLAIQQVTRPEDPFQNLGASEMELLRLILAGKRTDEIARSLGVAEKTVANRKTALRGRLKVVNDVELVRSALAVGLTVG